MIARQEYFKEVETAFDAEVQKFAQMTGAKINSDRLNEDTGSVVQKMDAAVKAGNPPDFAYFDRFVPELYQLGDIVDVSDVVSQISDAYGAPEDNVRINATVGGKYYGIPYSTQGAGYFARKDWLAEKGIKVTRYQDLHRPARCRVADLRPRQEPLRLGHDRQPERRRQRPDPEHHQRLRRRGHERRRQEGNPQIRPRRWTQ